MGRHAAEDYGRFTRELLWLILKTAAAAIVFFGAVWFLISVVPGWFGDDGDAAATTETTTTTTEAVVVSVPSTVPTSSVATTGSTTPEATTTLPPETTTTLPPETTTTLPPETTTTTLAQVRPPSEVVVIVLNSTGRSGLAAGLTEQLAGLGYQMLEQDNYSPALNVSQVLYAPGFAAEAYTLTAQVPDAEILANPSDDPQADIVVVLGASFSP
jgi:hypothetical protein